MKTPDLPCQIPDPSTYLNEPNRNNSVEKCIFAVRWKEWRKLAARWQVIGWNIYRYASSKSVESWSIPGRSGIPASAESAANFFSLFLSPKNSRPTARCGQKKCLRSWNVSEFHWTKIRGVMRRGRNNTCTHLAIRTGKCVCVGAITSIDTRNRLDGCCFNEFPANLIHFYSSSLVQCGH